jgi:hypothetical protein
MPIVWKSACLSLLENAWPVQACKWITLHYLTNSEIKVANILEYANPIIFQLRKLENYHFL